MKLEAGGGRFGCKDNNAAYVNFIMPLRKLCGKRERLAGRHHKQLITVFFSEKYLTKEHSSFIL